MNGEVPAKEAEESAVSSRGQNQTETLSPTETENEFGTFQPLDPLAVRLWRLEGLLGFGWMLPAALVAGIWLWVAGELPGWLIPPPIGLLALLLWYGIWWYPPRNYAAWSYRFSDTVLELRHGLFWQTSVLIPLSRVQHVDLNRGPLARRHGLSTLQVHTAGTQHANHEVPHLNRETAALLRERLIELAGVPKK